MNDNNTQINELLIARDIISMAHEYSDDFDTLEYLSNFAFNLARLHGDNLVDWDSIFSILDQAYSQKNTETLTQLTSIHTRITNKISTLR